MNKQTFDIDKLRVASPCPVGWDAMKGDARTRHCDLCQLNVYNVAEMTRAEVENLVARSEGRLCMRLYKRADGTVLTKDCPTGLRAYRKRVARIAGAALATVLGLFSVSFGQKEDKKAIDALKLKITRVVSQEVFLEGTITDPNGAVVPGAEISIFKDNITVATVIADENGYYKFASLASGIYRLQAKSNGFKLYSVKNLKMNDGESGTLNIALNVDENMDNIGVIVGDISPIIDVSSTGVQTTITKDMMNKLPH
jgi:hypothetical protein